MERLSREVNSIIAAPYVVSLKALYDIVIELEVQDLQDWALAKPCQIKPITVILCEAYTKWPFVTDLMAAFAEVVEVRNAMLSHKPSLLDRVITQVVHTEADASQSLQLAVNLLSHPLPDGIALPASFTDLLGRLLEHMRDNPTSLAVRNVYRVVCGVGPKAFELLPESLLSSLADRCRSGIQKIDEHIASTLCFAISSRFMIWTSPASTPSMTGCSSGEEQDVMQQKQWHQTITLTFTERYVAKTLDLLVMRMILFCSESCELSRQDTIEGIRLGRTVIDAVGKDHIRNYLSSKGTARFAKLQAKVAGQKDVDIKLEGLAFCILLGGYKSLSSSCRSLLLGTTNLLAICRTSPPAFEECIMDVDTGRGSSKANKSRPFALLLPSLIHICQPGQLLDMSMAKSLQVATKVCEGIHFAMEVSAVVRQEIVTVMHEIGIPDWWDIDPSMFSYPGDVDKACQSPSTCIRSIEHLRQSLGLEVSRIFLSAGCLHSMEDVRSDHLSAINKLISRTQQSATQLPVCGGADAAAEPSMVPVHQDGEYEPGISRQWRAQLEGILMEDASMAQTKIITFMGHVCHDYERRCSNVEEPLREAETRLATIQDELRVSREAAGQLQEQLAAKREQCQKSIDEKMQLHAEKVEVETRFHALVQQTDQLRHELSTDKLENEAHLRSVQTTSASDKVHYDAHVDQLQHALELERLATSILRDQVGAMKANVQRAEMAQAQGESDWSSREQHFEQQLATMRKESEQQNAVAERDLQNLNDTHRYEIAEMQRQLSLATEAADAASRSHGKDLSSLRKKIQCLRDDRNILRKDISQARELKAKLAALMGGDAMEAGVDSRNITDPEVSDEEDETEVDQESETITKSPRRIADAPQSYAIPPPLHRLQTPKPTHDGMARRNRKSMPSIKSGSVQRSTRHALQSVSPNRKLSSLSRRKSEAVARNVNFEMDERAPGQENWIECSKLQSFDENDDLMTSTDHRRLADDITIDEDTEFTTMGL